MGLIIQLPSLRGGEGGLTYAAGHVVMHPRPFLWPVEFRFVLVEFRDEKFFGVGGRLYTLGPY